MAAEFPFAVDDLTPNPRSFRSFVNVGLWRDWHSFYEQVGQYFRDDGPLEPFEAMKRSRTILNPQAHRLGLWELPEGTCE